MAGHTDKYAKYAFCRYLESKGYTEVQIKTAPVDISAKLDGVTWHFELKKTAKEKKYFGATTLTELKQAQTDTSHFRFIIAQATTEKENCTSFNFYELTLEQMEKLGNMSIPPFKVYFNIDLSNKAQFLQEKCPMYPYSYPQEFDETEYKKFQSHGEQPGESVKFVKEHIKNLDDFYEELKTNNNNQSL